MAPPPGNSKLAREKGPAVFQKTAFEALRDSWPTYEVHVYHDTGRTADAGHGPVRILEPQVPFGFLVNHTSTLVGWRHALAGRGIVLDEISPNFFHVRVPNGGVGDHQHGDRGRRARRAAPSPAEGALLVRRRRRGSVLAAGAEPRRPGRRGARHPRATPQGALEGLNRRDEPRAPRSSRDYCRPSRGSAVGLGGWAGGGATGRGEDDALGTAAAAAAGECVAADGAWLSGRWAPGRAGRLESDSERASQAPARSARPAPRGPTATMRETRATRRKVPPRRRWPAARRWPRPASRQGLAATSSPYALEARGRRRARWRAPSRPRAPRRRGTRGSARARRGCRGRPRWPSAPPARAAPRGARDEARPAGRRRRGETRRLVAGPRVALGRAELRVGRDVATGGAPRGDEVREHGPRCEVGRSLARSGQERIAHRGGTRATGAPWGRRARGRRRPQRPGARRATTDERRASLLGGD